MTMKKLMMMVAVVLAAVWNVCRAELNPPVSYLSPVFKIPGDPKSGQLYMETNWVSDYTFVQGSDNPGVVWGEPGKTTWYVADGDLVITNSTEQMADSVVISGDVRLVLKDGCDLKVFGWSGAAICVSGPTNAFTVYAQSTNAVMGRLTAETSRISVAGIGGGLLGGAGENITINGGYISAQGGPNPHSNVSYGSYGGPGIGGHSFWHSVGARNIFIHGGEVVAEGCSAGIGSSGYGAICSNIVISGGRIFATGKRGAGIGGGSRGASGPAGSMCDYVMTGGDVYAVSFDGSGIGGGSAAFASAQLAGSCSNIVISGGSVYARGSDFQGAPGIGGGTGDYGGDCVDVLISGGIVQAIGGTSGKWAGAGIGVGACGDDQRGDVKNVRITGGAVFAAGGNNASGIGDGAGGDAGTVESVFVSTALSIKADGNNPPTTVIANDGGDLAMALAGRRCCLIENGTIGPGGGEEPGSGEIPEGGISKYDATYIYDGEGHTINTQALFAVTLTGATPSFSFSTSENGPWQAEPFVYTNAVTTSFWYRISADGYYDFVHAAKLTITNPPVSYLSPVFKIPGDPKSGQLYMETNWVSNYTFVQSSDSPSVVWGEPGKTTWYVADGDLVITNGTEQEADSIVVSGDVRLVLKDGCDLKVFGGWRGAAICVCGPTNAFTVYAQSTNEVMGRLRAEVGTGLGWGSAGIGGSLLHLHADSENITINGGSITARGGQYGGGGGGAGVGSTYCASARNIFINGGEVVAMGAGAGIGTGGTRYSGEGYLYSCRNVVITGGRIMATGERGAGIGGGGSGAGDPCGLFDFVMTGGDVRAVGLRGAGIGGGSGSNGDGHGGVCSNVVISGGILYARGGDNTADPGIGGGHAEKGGACMDILIAGGSVRSLGGTFGTNGGAGIGVAGCCENNRGDVRNVRITGGCVFASGGSNASGIGDGVSSGDARKIEDVFVSTALSIKADGNNPPTTVIANDGGDLATVLAGKRYFLAAKEIGPGGGEEPGSGEIPEGGISKYDATYVYDGEGHTINTQALFAVTLTGATPSFSFSLNENGPWQTEPFVYTNVVTTSFWYRISADGYYDFVHAAKLTISKADVPPGSDPGKPDPSVDPSDPEQVKDPTIRFSPWDYVGMYDGAWHTVDTNAMKFAYVDKFGSNVPSFSFATTSNGTFGALAPSFKDVVATSFWYKVSAANYDDIIHPCKVIVTNRPVAVTSGTKIDFVYDGQPHAYTNLIVSSGSFVVGEGITTSNWATVTTVTEGQIDNVFDYMPLDGTKLSNYDFSVDTGKIAIAQAGAVTVTITGRVNQVAYDGTEKSVSGYDVVSISDSLYKSTDFKFTGNASTNGTDAGTYPMGLTSLQFVNTNDNFSAVTFNVTDGWLKIEKASVDPTVDPGKPDPSVDPSDPEQVKDPTKQFSPWDYVGMYDGEWHTVDTNAMKLAYADKFGSNVPSFSFSAASNGIYGALAPLFKDVVATSFWYKVSAANYNDIIHPCKVIITNRPVTVTSGTKTDFVADGQPHSYKVLIVTSGSFVAGEGIITSNWATVTTVVEGQVDNVFDYEPIAETKLGNYALKVVTGKIAVVEPVPPTGLTKVVFDALGGKIGIRSVVTQELESAYGTLPLAARENYVFQGWFLGVTNGAPQAVAGGALLKAGDHALFAKWMVDPAVCDTSIYKWEAIDANTARITGFVNPNQQIAKMVIPEMIGGRFVTEIATLAFSSVKCGATELSLPTFLTSIGDRAFMSIKTVANAYSLKKITFAPVRRWDDPTKAGALTIGAYAFSSETPLESLTLPAEVASIGNYAFANCRRMSSITILGKPTIGYTVFRNAGVDVGGVTVHIDPALAGDTAYMAQIKGGLANVTVKTDAVVTGIETAGLTMGAPGTVKMTLGVARAAAWGKVDTSALKVEYRETLGADPTMLVPTATENADGSVTLEVPVPDGGSGFLRVVGGSLSKMNRQGE